MSSWHETFTRRAVLAQGGLGLGALALARLLRRDDASPAQGFGPSPQRPHHRPRVRRVIQLFMAGAPSQFELFEPKPLLQKLDGEAPPASLVEGKRFAFIDGDYARLMGTRRTFGRHGQSGAALSELLPYTARIVDRLTWLRAVHTDEINHGPAKLFMNTGIGRFGRPSLGAWLQYAIGSEAEDLPGFVVLTSGSRGPRGGAPLWGSGFLPSRFAGTPLRSGKTPILHLETPRSIDAAGQKRFFETVAALERARLEGGDARALDDRLATYELAARMQTSAPELVDLASESEETRAWYGIGGEEHSFARNCLLARRLVERGVRFVQLYHADWDHHGDPSNHLGEPLEARCREVDQASAALVLDLERLGLLEDTLVVWGGEFGRTPMSEVRKFIGRDHHIEAFTMWLAGGGLKAGVSYGETDEIGYAPVQGAVHVHDLHATLLHLLGLDHERVTYRFQGRDFRLTDVGGRIVSEILA